LNDTNWILRGFVYAIGLTIVIMALVLLVLAFLPLVGGLLKTVVGIWVLVAGIVAIRQALDFSTGKAVLTALIGWLVLIIPTLLFGTIAAVIS